MGGLTYNHESFFLDGKPFRLLSGAMHYFRVHPYYWKDRMEKLKLMGLNTLETYVAWNLHEPRLGEFRFGEWLDLPRYVDMASELDLNVIVRPGPYICSEWDLGGLPSWLLKDPNMQMRSCYGPYLEAVDRFFDALIPKLVPLQSSKGGKLFAMQVENEYGSYGNDTKYLAHLEKGLRDRGIDVLLFTSDGPTDTQLQFGTLPNVLKTANFGSNVAERLALLRRHQPEGPLVCMEFWNGWFDKWGADHQWRDPKDVASVLDDLLSAGASVNFYMFHGGTNFGFTSGANCSEEYTPDVTSYDYGAPLDEMGDITPKYEACRETIKKHIGGGEEKLPGPSSKMSVSPFPMKEMAILRGSLDQLSTPVENAVPLTMETLDQNFGFVLYRTFVPGPHPEMPLVIRELHDRAHVFMNGALQGVLERKHPQSEMKIVIPEEGAHLDILVENMGRTNFSNRLHDRKGITECVLLNAQILFHWTMYPLSLEDLSPLQYNAVKRFDEPAFFRGSFEVENPEDSFLSLPGWTKGVCWLNGFNLGRYWSKGPQRTLYVPKPLFRNGRNEIVILELDGVEKPVVEFVDKPDLG